MRTTRSSPKSKSEKLSSKKKKRPSLASAPDVYYDMMKTEFGCLRISSSTFKGETRVDIRNYYVDRNSGELKPTKKGTAVPLNKVNALLARIKRVAELAAADDSDDESE